MTKKTKRLKEIDKIVGSGETYKISDAIATLKKCPKVKFDQSIELSLKLGVDPKKSDQQVRGTIILPHGSGKKVVVLVFAKGDKITEALEAGADYAGHEELVEKVKGGWTDFNYIVSTPDMMREVGKLGKILGPRGLMPSPKAGSVTTDVAKAIKEAKGGKIEFKVDKSSMINLSVGKMSFDENKLEENLMVLLRSIQKAKPSKAKGVYIRSLVLSSTMGPGLKIDLQSLSIS
jgi:large subunit ribosomal protein L1